MSNISTKNKDKVFILKTEYSRLKKLDQRFRDFWLYLENLTEIRGAREEIKKGKTITQEKLFKKIGF